MILNVGTGRDSKGEFNDIMVAAGLAQFSVFLQFVDYGNQIHRMVFQIHFLDDGEDGLMARIVENIGLQEVNGVVQPFFVNQEGSDDQTFEIQRVRRHFSIRNGKFAGKIPMDERG